MRSLRTVFNHSFSMFGLKCLTVPAAIFALALLMVVGMGVEHLFPSAARAIDAATTMFAIVATAACVLGAALV